MNMMIDGRPRNVSIAVIMLCCPVIYGFAAEIVSWVDGGLAKSMPQQLANVRHAALIIIVINLCLFVLNIFIIYKIFKGKSWARLVYLFYFVLGAVGLMLMFMFSLHYPKASTQLIAPRYDAIVPLLFYFVALVLLYSGPSILWFRRAGSSYSFEQTG